MRRTQYLLALIAPIIAAGFVILYGRATGGSVLYGTFTVAVFVAAIVGGLGPGLLATALSSLLGLALYADWLGLLPTPVETDPARLVVIVVAGIIASGLGGQVRHERIRSEEARLAETRAHRASEEALRRVGTLQSLTVDLSRSVTTAQIAEAVVRHSRRALGATGGVVFLVEADGQNLAVVTEEGYETEVVDRLRLVPLDAPLPAPTVVRQGEAMFLGDPAAYLERFPETPAMTGAATSKAIAMVPLQVGGTVTGAIGWSFAVPQVFDEDRRGFILTVGRLCSQAMERARAYEAERAARERVDLLARREAERSAELRSIISAIGDGLLVVEPDGKVRSMNAAAELALGGPVRDRDDLARRLRLDGDVLPPPGVPFGPAEYQLAERPGAWIELTAYLVEGPVAPGAPTSVWLVRDVTAFRQGQRLREAFLSLLSHELRTPVTTIYAAANVLGRSSSTLSPEVRQDILEDVVGESNRLYRLVEDLLVLARFDEGFSLGRDPNLVQHLVRGVVEGERLRWPGIAFEVQVFDGVPTVSGDETSIQQVLRNLLSNAAKYSPPGRSVQVVVAPEDDGAIVRVLDEGIGIRVEELGQLFDPFYRSPATAKMAGGAGIGLYVCRRLIEAMGGRVWAKPRETNGSEFGFWLPAYEESPGEEDGDGPSPAQPVVAAPTNHDVTWTAEASDGPTGGRSAPGVSSRAAGEGIPGGITEPG